MVYKLFSCFLTTMLVSLCSLGESLSPDDSSDNQKDIINIAGDVKSSIACGGEVLILEFTSTSDWTASSSADWCVVEPARGRKEDTSMSVTFAENTASKQRTASVTIKGGDAKKVLNFTQGAAPEKGALDLRIAADYRGPDFLFTIVEVSNTSNASVSAEIGIFASVENTMSNPKSGSAGSQVIPAGQTVQYQVTTSGLAENTSYYIQPFAKIGNKTYVSDPVGSGTEPLRFYISQTEKEYSFGSSSQTLDLCLVSNVPFEDPVISADWASIKDYKEEHYKTYNYYVFQIAANTTDQARTATITFASKKYNASQTVTIHQQKWLASTGETAGHAWVNFELPSGTLWATANVGAEKPEEYGRYVSWGETVIVGEEDTDNEYNKKNYDTYVKKNYSSYSYKFFHDEDFQEGDNIYGAGHSNVLHKYCKADSLTVLEARDDAASVKWGENWTTPSYEQVLELVRNTKYVWTDNYKGSGVSGGLFYLKKADASASYTTDDLHIFIPASGHAEWKTDGVGDMAMIWTKTLESAVTSTNPYYYSRTLKFGRSEAEAKSSIRYLGLCVRPVVK